MCIWLLPSASGCCCCLGRLWSLTASECVDFPSQLQLNSTMRSASLVLPTLRIWRWRRLDTILFLEYPENAWCCRSSLCEPYGLERPLLHFRDDSRSAAHSCAVWLEFFSAHRDCGSGIFRIIFLEKGNPLVVSGCHWVAGACYGRRDLWRTTRLDVVLYHLILWTFDPLQCVLHWVLLVDLAQLLLRLILFLHQCCLFGKLCITIIVFR